MNADQIACKEWTCSAEPSVEDRFVALGRISSVISIMVTTMRKANEDFFQGADSAFEEYFRVIERHADEAGVIAQGGADQARRGAA